MAARTMCACVCVCVCAMCAQCVSDCFPEWLLMYVSMAYHQTCADAGNSALASNLAASALLSCNDECQAVTSHLQLNLLCLIVLIVSRHLQNAAVTVLHMVCTVYRWVCNPNPDCGKSCRDLMMRVGNLKCPSPWSHGPVIST